MPKHQTPRNVRMTRLASSESPLAATTAAGAENTNLTIDRAGKVKVSKLQLPPAAAALRKALFADGKEPTDEEIAQTYTEIAAIVPGYKKKVHSNYFSTKRRARTTGRDIIAAQMENVPNPTMHDVYLWKYETGLSVQDVLRIVVAEVPDIVKERAKTEYLLNSCKL